MPASHLRHELLPDMAITVTNQRVKGHVALDVLDAILRFNVVFSFWYEKWFHIRRLVNIGAGRGKGSAQ
jgi:hypothetical protein